MRSRDLFLSKIFILIFLSCCTSGPPAKRTYLETAEKAALWLDAVKIQTNNGLAWPADPQDSTSIVTNLYSGSAGIVLFFLEAYRATENPLYLANAKAGADYLIATLPDTTYPSWAGLYTGVSGIGFVLTETYKITGEEKYRDAALRCVDMLHEKANRIGSGVEWDSVTDIISGSAGIGLFLLYAADELAHKNSLELAKKTGVRLMTYALPEKGGLKWPMSASFPRLMPNFSHGTAGVAYFLAALYEQTNDDTFLQVALKGADYLLASAETNSNDGLIFHHEPEGEDLFYLGWCHGPPGTARLYYKIYHLTSEEKWLAVIRKSAETIMSSGIPEKPTPGFWNNVGQCCGSAGVAEFFLALHQFTSEKKYLDFSKRLFADLLARSTIDGEGLKWVQAEHRVRPELLIAQTGYMQGAAGIGMLSLKLDNFEQGRRHLMTFPDSPF